MRDRRTPKRKYPLHQLVMQRVPNLRLSLKPTSQGDLDLCGQS